MSDDIDYGTTNVDFESALITAIIDTRDIRSVIQQKIAKDFFFTPMGKTAFSYLLHWYQNPAYGDTPSWESFMHAFNGFVPSRVEDSIIALCDKVREQKMYSDLAYVVQEVSKQTAADPKKGFELLRKEAARLSTMHTPDDAQDIRSMVDSIRENYLRMEGDPTGLRGYPYPWPALNHATLGLKKGNAVLFYGRPKTKKCICIDVPILSWDGSFTTIERLRHSVTLNHETQQWVKGRIVHHTDPEPMECFTLETESGHRVEGLGTTHPILRPDFTYTPTGQLKAGDWIGVARELPEFPVAPDGFSVDTAELLGLLIGDGCYSQNHVQFTNNNIGVIERLRVLVDQWDCDLTPHFAEGEADSYGVFKRSGKNNKLLDFLRSEGMQGTTGRFKTIPERIYKSGTEAVRAVLGGLLSTDGHVVRRGAKAAIWSTSSEALARQIKHLLLRIGVTGVLCTKEMYTGPSYGVRVVAQEQGEKLLCLLPYISAKDKADALINWASMGIRRKRHDDGIPWSQELEDVINASRPPSASIRHKNGAWPGMWNGFSASKCFRRTGMVSRHLLRVLASNLNAPQLLVWADSAVRWERVSRVQSIGVKMTSDAGVAEHHNFLVGDIVTHNTWLALKVIQHLHAHGLVPMIFTQELSNDEMAERYVALATGVDFDAYCRGKLPQHEKDEFFDNLDAFIENPPVVLDSLSAVGDEVEIEIKSKMEDHGCNVYLVDGLQMVGADWKELKASFAAMKRYSRTSTFPMIGTTHASKVRGKHSNSATQDDANDFAHADAFFQLCDMGVRITADIEDKKARRVVCFISAIRGGQQAMWEVRTKLCSDLEQCGTRAFADDDEESQMTEGTDGEEDVREPGDTDHGTPAAPAE